MNVGGKKQAGPTPISGVIITLNEADNIAACIQSIQDVCSEVIVVDSHSDDDTVAIAEGQGARVIQQTYLGDGPQRTHGVSFAKNDWILALDADERLDGPARSYIRSLALDDPTHAYGFKRKNYCGTQWIRAGGFYPDSVVRLFNRQKAGFLPKQGHTSVRAPKSTIGDGHIEHLTYRDLSDWIKRINELSSRDAWAMKNKGIAPSTWRPVLHALNALMRKLVLKGALFQGSDGMMVSITSAFRTYMKYSKLNEIYKANQDERR